MTTSTLDLIDWAACLDGQPGCEHTQAAGEAATVIARLACGCSAILCAPHADRSVQVIAAILARHCGIACATCGAELPGRFVSDVLTVVPL